MSLKQYNPYLQSKKFTRECLWLSAKTSSAIEGIHKPFAGGPDAWRPASTQELIDYWKQRVSKSRRA